MWPEARVIMSEGPIFLQPSLFPLLNEVWERQGVKAVGPSTGLGMTQVLCVVAGLTQDCLYLDRVDIRVILSEAKDLHFCSHLFSNSQMKVWERQEVKAVGPSTGLGMTQVLCVEAGMTQFVLITTSASQS